MKNKTKSLYLFRIFLLLSIILNAFILINAFIPGDDSAVASFWVADIFAKIINFLKADTINSGNIESFTYVIRKLIGHLGLFLIDGSFVGLTFYIYSLRHKNPNFWFSTLYIFLTGVFVASFSEMIQIFIPGRVGSINDFLIDLGGYLLALIVLFLIFLLKQSKKKSSQI